VSLREQIACDHAYSLAMSSSGVTYWGQCRFPLASPRSDGAQILPWELREVADGNFAAFATRNFEAGEVILIEKPLISVHGWHPFNLEQQEEIEANLAYLKGTDVQGWAAFHDLANVFEMHSIDEVRRDEGKHLITRASGIFMTNCFDMTDNPEGEGCAIYAAIARLNHSCQPNAQQTHLPHSGEEILIAARAILEGEEICDCYIDLRQSCKSRHRVLLELFRFNCLCEACSMSTSSIEADDKLREKAMKLDDLIITVCEEDPSIALDVALDYVRLLESPVVTNWSVRFIAAAHFSCYQLSTDLGNKKIGKEHLWKAHEWNVLLTGTESPASKRTLALLDGTVSKKTSKKSKLP
jgi:hypothetical protein